MSNSKKLSEVSRYSVMLFGTVPLASALSRTAIFSRVAALMRPCRIALLIAVASNPVYCVSCARSASVRAESCTRIASLARSVDVPIPSFLAAHAALLASLRPKAATMVRQFSGSCPVSRQNRSYSRRWFCSRI